MASLGSLKSAIFDREEKKMQYQSHIRGLNAYDRHKKFVKDYVQFYGNAKTQDVKLIKTDTDTIREGYRFILSEEDDMDSTWEKRLVRRYYDKLFKEYCIADMSQYKRGKIGLRWRTEKEVVSGKGQFICGNKHCDEKEGLGSYEVNFSYFEAGEDKQALVKLVACKGCAEKLAYRRQKERMRSEEREINALIQRLKHNNKRFLIRVWFLILVHSFGDQSKLFPEHNYTWMRLMYILLIRERIRHEGDDDDESGKSSDRRKKGKKSPSTSCEREDDKAEDEDGFDEFLEGMFP